MNHRQSFGQGNGIFLRIWMKNCNSITDTESPCILWRSQVSVLWWRVGLNSCRKLHAGLFCKALNEVSLGKKEFFGHLICLAFIASPAILAKITRRTILQGDEWYLGSERANLEVWLREAILYQIGCFFTHCVKGGRGSNLCIKIYVADLF